MLNKKDLVQIEEIFDRKFDEKFDTKFDEKFDEKFRSGIAVLMEDHLLPQFNLIHERFDKLEGRTATKSWVEERLDKFRVEHGLRYRPTN